VNASVKTWVGGTVVVCLAIIGIGWLLVISPQKATASDARDQTANVKLSNDTLEVQVTKLKKQFEQMDQYKTELGVAQKAIPTDQAMADLLRQLNKLADATKVVIVSVSPQSASGPAEPEKTAPTPAPSASASATPAPAPSPTETPATTIVQLPDGLQAIPLNLDVIGTYADTLKFVSGLQTKIGRYVLVTDISQTALAKGEASSGRPATEDGDLESAIGGVVYVLPSTTPTPAPTEKPKMPTSPKDKNVFAPPASASKADTSK